MEFRRVLFRSWRNITKPLTAVTIGVLSISGLTSCPGGGGVTEDSAQFNASATTGNPPLEVHFTDISTTTADIISWLWNFGDGQGSNLQNPVHVYTDIGTYTVSLTVVTADGMDTITKTDLVKVGAGATVSADFDAPATS